MSNELDKYIPDCLFASDNQYEIPSLRLDVQPYSCDIPFVCFGEQSRTKDMGRTGTLHFYTDDYRFNSVFEHPEKILKHNPANIVEPNFSLYNDTPVSFGLQAIYKKRYVARAMQERGIGVYVDLNVANKFYALNLYGIPLGYSSFCTRGYSDRLNSLEFEFTLAKRIANGNPLNFVVYGGGEDVKEWCRQNGCIYVTPIIVIKNKIKAMQKMAKNVAMVDGMFTPPALPVKELFDNQILDFSKEQKMLSCTEH